MSKSKVAGHPSFHGMWIRQKDAVLGVDVGPFERAMR